MPEAEGTRQDLEWEQWGGRLKGQIGVGVLKGKKAKCEGPSSLVKNLGLPDWSTRATLTSNLKASDWLERYNTHLKSCFVHFSGLHGPRIG